MKLPLCPQRPRINTYETFSVLSSRKGKVKNNYEIKNENTDVFNVIIKFHLITYTYSFGY